MADALAANGARLVALLARLPEAAWARRGTRRTGEWFTVDGLARFVLHEVRHHRCDAEMSQFGRN